MVNEENSLFDQSNLLFTPTTEAKALEWKSLYPSTQDALDKIIIWIYAAYKANLIGKSKEERLASEYEAPSTSILVSGDRGSGKTTVLLSAAYTYRMALEQKSEYFHNMDNHSFVRLALENTYNKVIWLNTLDLESLHPDSNLLTAMLVRIRKAIERLDYDDSDSKGEYSEFRSRRRSILEGDLGTGERLNRLINEATFMWETLPGGTGPRLERSEQQIKAAEIFADFQNNFKSVMDKTIDLAKSRGEPTELFVLPIDNVDRSIEHIANISKLIRLATSRRLWFILAAVRPDYQLFLERSFQVELLRSAKSLDPLSWDQTQAIARRQAATSVRRLLPENYQIRISPLSPEHSWAFPNIKNNEGVNSYQDYLSEKKKLEICLEQANPKNLRKAGSIKELLDSMVVTKDDWELGVLLRTVKLNSEKERFGTLADLFDISNQLNDSTKENYTSSQDIVFTGAGKMALGLSIRTLIDLKSAILAYHCSQVKEKNDREDNSDCAVAVSVRMLRNAIDESDIPFWASQQLLDRVIRKNSGGEWVLDLTNRPIKRFKQTQQFYNISLPVNFRDEKNGFSIEETLNYQEFPDVVLELHELTNVNSIPLPSAISGWFMILYDILSFHDKKRIVGDPFLPCEVFAGALQNCHKIMYYDMKKPVELIFEWKLPHWPTFVEHYLFAIQWTAILNELKPYINEKTKRTINSLENSSNIETISQIFQLVWIDNVCSVCEDSANDKLNLATFKNDLSKNDVHNLTLRVESKICELFKWSFDESPNFSNKKEIQNWFLDELPLFLKPEFSLLKKHNDEPRYQKVSTWPDNNSTKDTTWTLLQSTWTEQKIRKEALQKEIVRLSIVKNNPDLAGQSDVVERVMKQWFTITKFT